MPRRKPAPPKTTRPPGAHYLSANQIAARYGIDKATPWRWSAHGDFPKPVQISSGCTRWILSEVEAWDAARIARRAATTRAHENAPNHPQGGA